MGKGLFNRYQFDLGVVLCMSAFGARVLSIVRSSEVIRFSEVTSSMVSSIAAC